MQIKTKMDTKMEMKMNIKTIKNAYSFKEKGKVNIIYISLPLLCSLRMVPRKGSARRL